MKKYTRKIAVSMLGGFLLAPIASRGDPKIEEQVVGPVIEAADAQRGSSYVVSPRGVRLATVTRKGSRFVVIVDGVEGPRFDQIVSPTVPYVDPRPIHEAQRSLARMRASAKPHHAQPLVPGPTPVIFSKDGKRFAYVGRQGQEWVLVVDGKEVLRQPADGIVGAASIGGLTGTVDMRLQFTGAEGKHLLFARSVFGGFELWVDGTKLPGTYAATGMGVESSEPLVSPDGSRIAYVAQIDREKQGLIVDGKVAGYFGTRLQFSPDGKVLYAIAQDPQTHEQTLLVNGKPTVRATTLRLFVAPVGNRTIAVATQPAPDGSQKSFCIVDGKKVDATEVAGWNSGIDHVAFSPDGKRYAAACKGSQNVAFVVVDGKKAQHYEAIFQPEHDLRFSPDSSRVCYVARTGGKNYVVIDDEESDGFDGLTGLVFSPDSKRFAYWGQRTTEPGGYKLYVDGKSVGPGSDLIFSPDSARFAYLSLHKEILLDGKPTGLSGDQFVFSPNSKHLVVFGQQPSVDPKAGVLAQFQAPLKQGLFIDGQHVWGTRESQNLRYRAFTPDGESLFWIAEEPAVGANAGPGKFEWVTYLNGKPLARFDRTPHVLAALYTTPYSQFTEPPSAWSVGPDGGLTFLGPVGDSIKRFTIAAPRDTSIAMMLAQLASEPAPAADAAPAATPARQRRNTPAPTPDPSGPPAPTADNPAPSKTGQRPAPPEPLAAMPDAAPKTAKEKTDSAAAKAKAWLDALGQKSGSAPKK